MKLRLGAAVLLATLAPLAAVTTTPPAAGAAIDVTPPAEGSCHDLTWDEYYYAFSEPEPAVDCSARHTSVTVRVTELDPVADWEAEWPDIVRRESVPCLKDLVQVTGGRAAQVQLSAYSFTFYQPTQEQRDAGAAWVRCDAVLRGGVESLAPVPADLVLDGTRPPANVRKCRLGKSADLALTVCARRHKYIAKWTFPMRDDSYPGERAAREFALRKCRRKLGSDTQWSYEWVGSRYDWRAGLRSAVCLPVD